MSILKKSLALIAAFGVCSAGFAEEEEPQVEVDVKRISETFGHLIGQNLETPGIHFSLESIIKGITDAVAGKPAPMTEEEYERVMSVIQERAFKLMAKNNLVEAESYLSKNRAMPGVIELEDRKLQYEVLEEGTGATVEPHAVPLVHYIGKYADGSVFGSSHDAGHPVNIPLDQTIAGFSKGLVGMKEGEKRRLFIHPELGYGVAGNLPPNSLLIFDVEVLKAKTNIQVQASTASNDEQSIREMVR